MQPWIRQLASHFPYYVNHAIISCLISIVATAILFFAGQNPIFGVVAGPAFYTVREIIQWRQEGYWDMKGFLGGLPPLLALVFWPTAAHAHSWYDGDCCSDQDCAPVAAKVISAQPGGYLVTLEPGDHPLAGYKLEAFFPFDDSSLRQSQDHQFHACVVGKETGDQWIVCLYVPDAAT